MSTRITITASDGLTINSVYPKLGFAQSFQSLDSSYKWEQSPCYDSLGDKGQMFAEIDSVINNIENLDLA